MTGTPFERVPRLDRNGDRQEKLDPSTGREHPGGSNGFRLPVIELAFARLNGSHGLANNPECRAEAHLERPVVAGKFLYSGDQKLWIRGITYGPFRPASPECEYPAQQVVDADLASMAANGFNAIRTYTVPPRWLLDSAQRHGLRVMVGLAWEQHVAFLEERARERSIEARVGAGVRACAGHPAILCYAIGNEIPASIVRWYGPRRVERFLQRLHCAAKAADPDGLVTYVNYPTTEYLELDFIDFVCFNVYLESQLKLDAYLGRLQNLAHGRPLVLAELGIDSRRHGEDTQAQALEWQLRTSFAGGVAGAFVFAWTDEWFRGGYDVQDWDFGLTRRDRSVKPGLAAVREALTEVPFRRDTRWPRISAIVCSHNGDSVIKDCLEGLLALDYPDFEVIVVDDGSTDQTAAIAREFDVRLISLERGGLSNARNVGLAAAAGEIVAYIDDDARPDPDWLKFLAHTFLTTEHVGVGGPNIPTTDGPTADSVANAPGGPTHVLLSDRQAEHIPGCNMAFRKAALQEIGGFDQQFEVAGDDVDICWRLSEQGWSIGFNPGAMVWHRRRSSVRAYWRQQKGYGRAEALLERKWPEKFNAGGQVLWAGRLYGFGNQLRVGWRRPRVYHGVWGSAPFQHLYQPTPGTLSSLPLMPEWYLLILVLGALTAVGAFWRPMLLGVPLLALTVATSLAYALKSAARARIRPRSSAPRAALRGLTAFLYLVQPLARLTGRLSLGLTPWRRRGNGHVALPLPRSSEIWTESWQATTERLTALQAVLKAEGVIVVCAGHHDRWDLEVRCGSFSGVRIRMAVEEHGSGRQLVRLRAWSRFSPAAVLLTGACTGLAAAAAFSQAWIAAATMSVVGGMLVLRTLHESAVAMATLLNAWQTDGRR